MVARKQRRNPTALEENEDAILNTDVVEAQISRAESFIESFPYTTTAVFALQLALERRIEWEEGAEILAAAVSKLAKAEAKEI